MLTSQRFVALKPSPLHGVSDALWKRFYGALDVQPIATVSPSGGFGSYDLRPRRLEELGVMSGVHEMRSKTGRLMQVGEFKVPWTKEILLSNPLAQYTLLARSMALYDQEIRRGALEVPAGLPRLEALALLHRAGRGGLKQWPKMIFSDTSTLLTKIRSLS